ncbi:Protein mrg1 [Orobanche gracilis]
MVNSSREESASDGENSSGDAPESAFKKLFSEGEKVLAFHGPRIYEAKVQKAELRKNEWGYFVHYLGWDEWVGMDRLMKNTEENILKQQALDKKAGVDKNTKSGRSAQTKPRSSADTKVDKEEGKNAKSSNGSSVHLAVLLGVVATTSLNIAKGKKRKADSGVEDNRVTEKFTKIQISANLKKHLVNDWEQITHQNKLLKLPRSPTVDDILTKYLEFRSKKDGMMTDAVGEILNGVRSYFDKALPAILLYKKERQQYREAIQDNISPSSIYGAEHLLRLFVKLPELLAYVKIEEETLLRLQHKLIEFLKFLQNNESAFFLSSYDGPKAAEGGSKGKGN